MCVCVRALIYVCAHAYMCARLHASACICLSTFWLTLGVCACVPARVCARVCMCARVHVCARACVRAGMCARGHASECLRVPVDHLAHRVCVRACACVRACVRACAYAHNMCDKEWSHGSFVGAYCCSRRGVGGGAGGLQATWVFLWSSVGAFILTGVAAVLFLAFLVHKGYAHFSA